RQTENGIRVYYATYIFDDANLMAPMSLAALVPMILGILIAPKLAGKFGVRRCVYWGLGISIVAYVIMTAFSERLPAMIIGRVIGSIGVLRLHATLPAIVAVGGGLVEWKPVVPVQGSVLSLGSAGMKVGQGITSGLVAWCRSLGGYIAGASVQPDSALTAIKS